MSTGAVALGLLLALVGCGCFYLASPHQHWRAQPLPAKPARAAASALWLVSLYAFSRAMDGVPAVFTFLLAIMLPLVVLPYVGAALVTARRER